MQNICENPVAGFSSSAEVLMASKNLPLEHSVL